MKTRCNQKSFEFQTQDKHNLIARFNGGNIYLDARTALSRHVTPAISACDWAASCDGTPRMSDFSMTRRPTECSQEPQDRPGLYSPVKPRSNPIAASAIRSSSALPHPVPSSGVPGRTVRIPPGRHNRFLPLR